MKNISIYIILLIVFACESRWTKQKANDWYKSKQWGAGVNYIPAYADNPIQMWQKLNLTAIKQQMIWAKNIGFSYLRVFLHISPYIRDPQQFLINLFSFTSLAKTRGLQVIPVLFDDCWKQQWYDGDQPNPIKGLHNSQWVQCPGKIDIGEYVLKKYVTDVVNLLKNSDSVIFWDIFNQVGGFGNQQRHLPLLLNTFRWVRQINPIQPITSGYWNDQPYLDLINQVILQQSDIITFHAYCDANCTASIIQPLRQYGRPIICTQYMARTRNSTFQELLPFFKLNEVWAINWGFVFGRTQTYYPWQSKQGAQVPQIWFHDVVHPDGIPYNREQTDLIRSLTLNNLSQ